MNPQRGTSYRAGLLIGCVVFLSVRNRISLGSFGSPTKTSKLDSIIGERLIWLKGRRLHR
jgi:hypothetical protein